MRNKVLLVLSVCLLTALIAASAVHTSVKTTVAAESMFQDVPRLDGYQIYFTEASGEASRFDRSDSGLSRLGGLLRQLGATLFTLEWRTTFPADADLIVIAGPTNDLSAEQVVRLWSYVSNGGSLLLLPSQAGEFGEASLASVFRVLWAEAGIRARNDMVATEATAGPMPTPRDSAGETPAGEGQASNAPALIVNFSTNNLETHHPITADLQGPVVFFLARSLEVDASIQPVEVTPLIFTDSEFYGETAYIDYYSTGTAEYNIGSDTSRGPLALAAAYSNPVTGSRVVVIGDRYFATNGGGLQTSPPQSRSFLYPGNVRFLLNAITWLLETEPVTVSFPTPAPTATATITPSPTPSPTSVEPTATPSS